MRRNTAFAAFFGFGLSVAMHLATFGGATFTWPLALLLLLGMCMAGIGGLFIYPSSSYRGVASLLETRRKSLFALWSEREALALLDDRARVAGSNEELDVAKLTRLLRPHRAAIVLFFLGLYAVVNMVVIAVLLRGGSLEQDALGYFLQKKGGVFIARLSESEGAWIQASVTRFFTSIMACVFFFAYCVWRMPRAPHAEAS